MRLFSLVFSFFTCAAVAAEPRVGNRLTYLDEDDPFHPHLGHPRLTTPQWIGEDGVDAVVILSIDDLREPKKWEHYLRPVLERLKRIEENGKPSGRAPVTIFCNQFAPDDPQFQTWLQEGLSLDVHTLTHPCPCLGKEGTFEAAWQTFHGGVDLLASIPNNQPVAYRMPCCDSMNSASPRFFAEIFSGRSPQGRFLSADSSVACLLTPKDPALPRELMLDAEGKDRFRKYFAMELVPPRKVTFERYAGYIEDYPYPYVIGRGIWEFPFVVPSDWTAFNAHGSKNPRTTEDWKAALDAVVLKQGVMTMVLHPHGWSDPQQIVELIDHAVAKHGRKVKFLNMREAVERLEKHVLAEQTLRSAEGGDHGIRLLDLNHDGFMDAVIANKRHAATRVWNPTKRGWDACENPAGLVLQREEGGKETSPVSFGVAQANGSATVLISGSKPALWTFGNGRWNEEPSRLKGLDEVFGEKFTTGRTTRFRDFDGDGICELLVGNSTDSAIFRWSQSKKTWEREAYSLPQGVALLNEHGEDNGLRFVDLNGDGFDDVFFSHEKRFSIHLWATKARPDLGWAKGWSHLVRSGERKGDAAEPPPFLREGEHRNNGAWFKAGHLVVQNEDTAKLEGVVDRRSFADLIAFDIPKPLSPEESKGAMRTQPGFGIECVAAEPLVIDPIAFEWDAKGRLYVVEMRDYPLGMDGKGKPGGVVKLLEDADGDGRYDKATAFLEDLPFPTGVMPWRNGAIIFAVPDILYAEDTNGDGRADVRRTLFTGFKPGNQQHRANGFEWGLDGWIYGANGDSGGEVRAVMTVSGGKPKVKNAVSISGRDFRFRPDTGEFEAESGQTQYGRRRDDWGNWFGNNNPTWVWHYTVADRYLRRNPKLAVKSVKKTLANYDASTRVFPISEQPIRFNQPQSLGHVTSACSASPYRDELFGSEFAESIFISEPVHNVVHREVLKPDGATFTSRRAEDEVESEFLASKDVWFRPTMVKTGPDGALYVADMYRFVLEHPEWIAPETQARLNLRAGEDHGRIYRVAPVDKTLRRIPDLAGLAPATLVAAMDSANGWQRDTVQRLIHERSDQSIVPALEKMVEKAANPKVRVQALATLAVLNAANSETVMGALRDPHPGVRTHALRVSETVQVRSQELLSAVTALEEDPDFSVRRQLAFTLGEFPMAEARAALLRMAKREGTEPHMRIAILSSVPPESPLMTTLREEPSKKITVATAPEVRPGAADRAKVVASFAGIAQLQPDVTRGRQLFQQLCSACHRFKTEGREVGPDLAMVAGKPDDWLVTALFDPNQAVEARYQAQHVKMKDGAEWLGIIASETGNNITLRTADGQEHALLRAMIGQMKPMGRSLMPEGFENALKPQDVADLLGFLRRP